MHFLNHTLPRLVGLVIAALPGSGCASPLPAEPTPQERFVADMQSTLLPAMRKANQARYTGVLRLSIILDENGKPLSCEARATPSPQTELGLGTAPQALIELAQAQCRDSSFPPPPAMLLDDKRQVEVVAPLIFADSPAPEGAYGEYATRHVARQAHAWAKLIDGEPVSGPGSAFFWYEGDASGKVQRCLVDLWPSTAAPAAFKADDGLAARLQRRCMALDLRQLGFFTDGQGRAHGHLLLDYGPAAPGTALPR